MVKFIFFAMTYIAAAQDNATAGGASGTVYIIRHGEKTSPHGCLSIAGELRARSIYSIFKTKFTLPSWLYACNYHNNVDCERCQQTLNPIAHSLDLSVDMSHGYSYNGGNSNAATAIKNRLSSSSVVLVAWEHVNIQYLTADLGVSKAEIPHWSGSDYNTVYILEFSDGELTSFKVSAERIDDAVVV